MYFKAWTIIFSIHLNNLIQQIFYLVQKHVQNSYPRSVNTYSNTFLNNYYTNSFIKLIANDLWIFTDASLFSLRRRRPLVLRYEVFETGEAKIESIGNSKSILIKTVYYDSCDFGKSCDFKYIFNGLCLRNYKKTILIEKCYGRKWHNSHCSWDKYEILSKPFLIKLIFE